MASGDGPADPGGRFVVIIETPWGRMPEPKFATPRNFDLPTRGPLDAEFAKIWLGTDFMPWQRMASDVAGEYEPETGLPVYSLIIGTVQRRGGKTKMTTARKARKCMTQRNHRSWYTAQTGGDARDAFLKFAEEDVQDAPLGKVVRTLRGNGHEVMKFPNGSTIRPHPPTDVALHGKEGDDNDVDEAWSFEDDAGKALMQAIAPTQMTRPGAQTFIWSAGGTAASTWLAALVAKGRALCSSDDPATIIAACRAAGIAFLEFGIPDDLPLDDLEAIAHYHPAFGHTLNLASMANLRSQLTDDNEFARAAGNRWTEIIGGIIPAALWKSVQWHEPVPEDAPIGFGAARSQDGSQVAIVAAVDVGDRIIVEVCDILPTAWRAAEHVEGWAGDEPLAVGRSGPSAPLFDDLVTRDNCRNLEGLGARDASAACGQLEDSLPHRGIVFRPHPALDDAIPIAGKRSVDGGGWVWAHTGQGQIAVLEAATNAVRAVKHRAPEPGEAVFAT